MATTLMKFSDDIMNLIGALSPVRFIIGTTSNVKKMAIENVRTFGIPDSWSFDYIDVEDDTRPEQPLASYDDMKSINDLATSRFRKMPTDTTVVAIENMFLKFADMKWGDVCAVTIRDCTNGVEIQTFSSATFVDDKYIDEYMLRSQNDSKLTIGKIIAELHPKHPPHNDWSEVFGYESRNNSIKRTFIRAFEQYVTFLAKRCELQKPIEFIPDFPKVGVTFQNVLPLFENAILRGQLRDLFLCSLTQTQLRKYDMIAVVESRGFLFGTLFAQPSQEIIIMRKPGKLPGKLIREEVRTEYSSTALEMADRALSSDARILVVDDVLATGGTLKAAVNLLVKCGATPSNITVFTVTAVNELRIAAENMLNDMGVQTNVLL